MTGENSKWVAAALSQSPAPLRNLLPPLPVIDDDDSNSNSHVVRVYVIRHGQTNWNLEGRIQGGGFDIPLNKTGKLQARLAAKALEGIPLDVVASSSMLRAKETADILMETMLKAGNSTGSGSGENDDNSSNNNNNNNKEHHANHNCRMIRRFVDSGFDEMKFGALEGMRYTAITGLEHYVQFKTIKQRVVEDPDYCFPAFVDGYDHEQALEEITTTKRVLGGGGGCSEGESTRIVQERCMGALSRLIFENSSNSSNSSNNDNKSNNKESTETTTTTLPRHVAIVAHGRTNKVLIAAMLYGEAHGRFKEIQQGNVNISVLDYEYDSNFNCNYDHSCNYNFDCNYNCERSATSEDSRGCWKSILLNYTKHVEGLETPHEIERRKQQRSR